MRGKSTSRAENRIESVSTSAETRLIAEMTALQIEHQRIVTEAARAKATKKSSGWW
jgi:ribosomal protein L17